MFTQTQRGDWPQKLFFYIVLAILGLIFVYPFVLDRKSVV